jgi:DNA-binding response OmpR family regulator
MIVLVANNQHVARLIRNLGFHTLEASTADAAMELVELFLPQVVIADRRLRTFGRSLADAVRANHETRHTLVYDSTNEAELHEALEALASCREVDFEIVA